MNNGYNNQNMNGYPGGPMPNGMPPQPGMPQYQNNPQNTFFNGGSMPNSMPPIPPQPNVPGAIPDNNKLDPNFEDNLKKLDEEIEASKKADKKLIMFIIIGVIGLISAVAITILINNIFSSVKNAEKEKMSKFVEVASEYIKNAKLEFSDSSLSKVTDDSLLILMPVGNDSSLTCVNGTSSDSPFSKNWKLAYVGLIYNTKLHMFDYYFIGIDGSGNGMKFTSEEAINKENVKAEEIVKKNLSGYASALQSMYESGSNHTKASPTIYGDDDLTEFAANIGAKTVAVLSQTDCSKLKG